MRPDSTFNATSLSGVQQQQQHSPWHSPVPYLFGGLAAMLGLIAFALLILACSYWKLSGYFDNDESHQGGDVIESGDKPLESIKVCHDLQDQKIVVIMAGDQKPTFIATPMSSKASSFNLSNELIKSCDEGGDKKQSDEHKRGQEQRQGQNQNQNQGQGDDSQ